MARKRVDKQGRATWEVRYRTRDGRRPSRKFSTEAEALEFEAKVVRAKSTDTMEVLDAGNSTIGRLASEWWDAEASHLAIATQEGYANLVDKYILPGLEHVTIAKLCAYPKLAFDFQSDLSNRVGTDTVRKTMFVLQAICRFAVERGYATANPIREIKKPKLAAKEPVVPLSLEKVEWMRAVSIENGEFFDAVLIATLAFSGLRPGEALALRWRDVRDRVIHVNKSAYNAVVKETKTGVTRSVSFLAPLADDLDTWRSVSRAGEDDLVFPNSRGELFDKDDWDNWRNRCFQPLTRLAMAKGMRPYDLRHVFVSLLMAEGKSVPYIAGQAGHSQEMTLRTYSHLMAEYADGKSIDAAAEIERWRSVVAQQRAPRGRAPDAREVAEWTLHLVTNDEIPAKAGISREPMSGFEPLTPSLRVKCSTS